MKACYKFNITIEGDNVAKRAQCSTVIDRMDEHQKLKTRFPLSGFMKSFLPVETRKNVSVLRQVSNAKIRVVQSQVKVGKEAQLFREDIIRRDV